MKSYLLTIALLFSVLIMSAQNVEFLNKPIEGDTVTTFVIVHILPETIAGFKDMFNAIPKGIRLKDCDKRSFWLHVSDEMESPLLGGGKSVSEISQNVIKEINAWLFRQYAIREKSP